MKLYRKSEIKDKKSKINQIVFLVGPTAIGKSEVAVSLAKKMNAEIISCDSMQIYKGMDIITAKPSLVLRGKVKHHLIDVVAPEKEFNVSGYRNKAALKIKEILKRGKIPLLVGGSGLYMSILIDGIFKEEAQNKDIRQRLYNLARKQGLNRLYKRLQKLDREAANRIHPHDAKRIIRALEVFQATGKPISVLQKERKGLKDEYDVRIFCLNMERKKLYKRIDNRVEKMFKYGLVKEVRMLLKKDLSRTAKYAIGIKELKGYFDGERSLEETKQLIQLNSRRYAKRQLTWFRRDKRIKWINIKDKDRPKEVAERIWKNLR